MASGTYSNSKMIEEKHVFLHLKLHPRYLARTEKIHLWFNQQKKTLEKLLLNGSEMRPNHLGMSARRPGKKYQWDFNYLSLNWWNTSKKSSDRPRSLSLRASDASQGKYAWLKQWQTKRSIFCGGENPGMKEILRSFTRMFSGEFLNLIMCFSPIIWDFIQRCFQTWNSQSSTEMQSEGLFSKIEPLTETQCCLHLHQYQIYQSFSDGNVFCAKCWQTFHTWSIGASLRCFLFCLRYETFFTIITRDPSTAQNYWLVMTWPERGDNVFYQKNTTPAIHFRHAQKIPPKETWKKNKFHHLYEMGGRNISTPTNKQPVNHQLNPKKPSGWLGEGFSPSL